MRRATNPSPDESSVSLRVKSEVWHRITYMRVGVPDVPCCVGDVVSRDDDDPRALNAGVLRSKEENSAGGRDSDKSMWHILSNSDTWIASSPAIDQTVSDRGCTSRNDRAHSSGERPMQTKDPVVQSLEREMTLKAKDGLLRFLRTALERPAIRQRLKTKGRTVDQLRPSAAERQPKPTHMVRYPRSSSSTVS